MDKLREEFYQKFTEDQSEIAKELPFDTDPIVVCAEHKELLSWIEAKLSAAREGGRKEERKHAMLEGAVSNVYWMKRCIEQLYAIEVASKDPIYLKNLLEHLNTSLLNYDYTNRVVMPKHPNSTEVKNLKNLIRFMKKIPKNVQTDKYLKEVINLTNQKGE